MNETNKLKEVELYKPIQAHLVREGYEVYGEVNDCDLVAKKGPELVIIELKLNLTVDLLIQATKRQKMSEVVYIAIPKPKKHNPRSRRWRDLSHLVRRLELGLIFVSFSGRGNQIEIVIPPTPFNRLKSLSQNNRKRQALLKEMAGRSADYNIGGSSQTQIMTAYRENCIQIATFLMQAGELSPKALIDMGTGKKTQSILSKNFYGWFTKVKRGVYCISDKGERELKQYAEVLEYYREWKK
ncbi:DUF2161 domain-containing phosphodiesterase [Radiobacillus sp. PE A8.2]|uniref:DUF2161 domain-containing phosphodiesterase n=1 Tax=Radiobacillus sp. PE A8.2 TaxID=3380349 RepID=UPI00388E6FF5